MVMHVVVKVVRIENCERGSKKAMTKPAHLYLYEGGTEVNSASDKYCNGERVAIFVNTWTILRCYLYSFSHAAWQHHTWERSQRVGAKCGEIMRKCRERSE